MKQRRLWITTALPYANGPLHLGHLLEHIQSDVWTRFQKMQGHDCLFLCGEDAHGTPIMLKAAFQNISPEKMIADIKASHENDLKAFHIQYDAYHTTHSSENKQIAEKIYLKLKARGDISQKEVLQSFDPIKNIFLPDRYIKGYCPRCNAADQYGDNCEACGTSYSPSELKEPYSVLSRQTPIQKTSMHLFFELAHYQDFLKHWLKNGPLQTEIANKLFEWFKKGLKNWDISRDAPYFGFKIPGEKNKYFYVWLDAPMGYLASLKKFCNTHSTYDFDQWCDPKNDIELYHFIGKDIIYFHGLFWPAILKGAELKQPNNLFVHGFLTINGKKMSKSRGTFITAQQYLTHLNPEYLRYYFSAKLTGHIEDIDLNLANFKARVNADLIGKIVNIASRASKFIQKYFDHRLSKTLDNAQLIETASNKAKTIANYYENRNYAKAIREIMQIADLGNQYINEKKPWLLIKDPSQMMQVQSICSTALNLFRLLIIYLKPIVPNLAQRSENFLNIDALHWQSCGTILLNHKINNFQPLMTRITDEALSTLATKVQNLNHVN